MKIFRILLKYNENIHKILYFEYILIKCILKGEFMKKFFIGMVILGTSVSVATLVILLYNFVRLLGTLSGG